MTSRAALRCVELLVLDEADRLLHMGARPLLDMLLRSLPAQRHTAMLSATISAATDELVRAGLRAPVGIKVHGAALVPVRIGGAGSGGAGGTEAASPVDLVARSDERGSCAGVCG